MARISGVTLPDKKKISLGLTTIYGVGRQNALVILQKAGIDPNKKVVDLGSEELVRLTKAVSEFSVEGGLRKQVEGNLKRLKVTGSYRGIRHQMGLPSRGQRTRSNARTRRGKRRTVGAMRKKDLTKVDAQRKEKKA